MIFYHVTKQPVAEGSILLPGNWGRIIRAFGYRHNFWPRETALEYARLQVRANAPSRLDCLFGVPTEVEARSYRLRENVALDLIYEVEPVDAAAQIFFGPLDVLERWDPADPARPVRYWNEGHEAGQPAITPMSYVGVAAVSYEVLLGGAARVLRRLPD